MDARLNDASAPGIELCPSLALAERGRGLLFEVWVEGQVERAFALRIDGVPVAYLNRCLHVQAELDWQPGEFLGHDRRFIVCSLHGATYEPTDGRCVGGPCGRGRLMSVTVREQGGVVRWYPSTDIRAVDGQRS